MPLAGSHRRVLLCGLLILCSASVTAAPSPPPPVFVAEARLDQFVDRVEALGTLRANESVVLTAQVTETISALHFDDGERVEAGQLLVEMTSSEEHAQLEEAQATLEEADQQYRRVKSLSAQGTASQSLLDERRREWETARARLAAIESRLVDRLIKAPFAGVVGLRNLSIGALVEPGVAVVTLDDDSIMKLEFSVPSTFLASLQPGLPVHATTRAYGERRFDGRVKSIDSRIDPVTRAVRVRALLDNADRALKPGMLMQVALLKNPRRALVIPEAALMPLADKQFVLVVDERNGNTVSQRELRIGARRPGQVEVLDGLTAGDKVITDGTLRARPGQTVTITAIDDGVTPLDELLQPRTP